jgi:hypothetical protein
MGFIRQDELVANFFTSVLCLFIFGSFTLVIGLISVGVFLWKRRIGKLLSYALVIGCSSIISIIVYPETSNLINRWKVGAVENYVARAVPILDQIKSKEGAYPTNLPTGMVGEPPELLRDYGDYEGTQSTFRFEYVDEPAEWAGGAGLIEFDSTNREWTDAQ